MGATGCFGLFSSGAATSALASGVIAGGEKPGAPTALLARDDLIVHVEHRLAEAFCAFGAPIGEAR